MSDYLDVKEIAERLRVSEQTIRRLYRSGLLPGVKVGRQIRVTETAIQAYLNGTTNVENNK